jgi:hypothetical protein
VLRSFLVRLLGSLVTLLVPEPRDDRPDVLVRELAAVRLHAAVGEPGPAELLLHVAAALDHAEVRRVGQVALRSEELVVEEVRRDALLPVRLVAVARAAGLRVEELLALRDRRRVGAQRVLLREVDLDAALPAAVDRLP